MNTNPFVAIVSCLFLFSACGSDEHMFKRIHADHSGLTFINEITENDSLNILDNEFVYNGAGVAIGDLNGDGLDDLFFAGNQVDNRLYLNQGQLKFIDVTTEAKVGKTNDQLWSSGVSIVDINLDGRLDIYVCNTLEKDARLRRNLLYVNQGNSDDGTPIFSEEANAYGIADTSHSSHAQFFDYDNDGDLDLFVGVNLIEEEYPNQFVELVNDGSAANRDNLFQNNWSDSLGHPVFTDVSIEAGILQDGYSHSTLVHDFNEDGWLDIYVANDYESNDLIFINNRDGTFTNRAGEIFKHFSLSAMGSDVGDINNDGRADFITSEMQPYYNKRKKLFQGESNYQNQILTRQYKYEYQYTRNTLQLNFGDDPKTGLPIYADIGMYAKVQETDWSWATLFADYDNDGWEDLYIVNGFPKDVTDRDFADFRAFASQLVSREALFAAIPEVKSPNFMFRNLGNLKFEDATEKWNLDVGSFSNGAALGDLDLDGDLDLVVNNIDDPVFLFENRITQVQPDRRYLRVKLIGPEKNPDGFGSHVTIWKNGRPRVKYLLSGRGYLSKSENTLHFGLAEDQDVDSIIVFWPGGYQQKVGKTVSNQMITLPYEPDSTRHGPEMTTFIGAFEEVTHQYQLQFDHQEIDFIDYNFQRTLPHKFSQYGPSIAVGDVSGDGLDDLFLGGSRSFEERWFFQDASGSFMEKRVSYKSDTRYEEDAGTLLFDADQDGDLDLYIVRGGAQYEPEDSLYQDVLLVNTGTGDFVPAPNALPDIRANGSCVKAADYDHDGDLDLFVGSRVLPRAYPLADRSYILENQSDGNKLKFVDVTEAVNPALTRAGLISDALWTDYNGDHWPDLILAGEWMPLRIFENNEGALEEITANSGLENYQGWWTSLAAADLDNDGDVDYVAGNFGENLYFSCDNEHPLRIYGQDLDQNGSIDPLISCYWRDSLGDKHEYLYHPRQDVIKQFVGIRKRFNTFAEFGEATVPEMFTSDEMDDAIIYSANWMKSSWIENLGKGRFAIHPLNQEAQLAPIYGMLPMDLNQDNYQDLLLVGNDFGMEVQQGRADAFVGLMLTNNKLGSFGVNTLNESHFYVPGDAKSLALISVSNSIPLFVASQNQDSLKVFQLTDQSKPKMVRLEANEVKCMLSLSNGQTQMQEFYYGNTFQSQSSRVFFRPVDVQEMIFYDGLGEVTRIVSE